MTLMTLMTLMSADGAVVSYSRSHDDARDDDDVLDDDARDDNAHGDVLDNGEVPRRGSCGGLPW
ncbi:hypothetical protein [Streptosporangium sp. NPDC002524]|uniref:hypothetical protein n=1 Tax=Streptosporangium sp. NPDC002524 TaxID=3154537 RepID=UPI00332A7D98